MKETYQRQELKRKIYLLEVLIKGSNVWVPKFNPIYGLKNAKDRLKYKGKVLANEKVRVSAYVQDPTEIYYEEEE